MSPSSLRVGIYECQILMLGTGLSGSFTQHLRNAQLKTVFRFTHDKARKVHLCEFKASLILQNEFQDTQGYTQRNTDCIEKTKQNQKQGLAM